MDATKTNSGSSPTAGATQKDEPTRWLSRRRWTKFAAAAVVAIILLGAAALVAVASGTFNYTIVEGDTLSELAEEYGTDVDTLVGLNEIDDPDLIITGDNLLIPEYDGADSGFQSGDMYTIQPGDTLGQIADLFGVSVDDIVVWNDIENPDLIVTGDDIVVSPIGEPAENVEPVLISVPAGDALEEVEEPNDNAVEPAEDEPSATDETVIDDESDLTLHLVIGGQMLEDVAEQYNVTVTQLIAANWHARNGITDGMILRIPPAGLEGARLLGMPSQMEQWPLMSEISAVALATQYWGADLSADEILEQLPRSENPHLGLRGNPQGMFGMTDDYGVYHEPLAEVLTEAGFQADAFYSDGDPDQLIARINDGMPVVVWVTFQLEEQEREIVESELGRYSLVPEQHALLVYGYDDSGVEVIDVSDGGYKNYEWQAFLRSWNYFDGMSLAIAPQ